MKQNPKLIEAAEQFVKSVHNGDSSGHDWWHIHRVRSTAVALARKEQADLLICELAALLHDVADEKLNPSKEAGLAKVSDWLIAQAVDTDVRNRVMEIIASMSYNGGTNPPMCTLEGQIVQDADRLDAIGAIGIGRAFAYGGSKNRSMHEPGRDFSGIGYRSEENTTIHHFYEKLLKLKDLMNTEQAKRMAEDRHQFMLEFLDRFYREWDASDLEAE